MSDKPSQLDVAHLMAELRSRFIDQLALRIEALRQPLQQLIEQRCAPQDLETLHRDVHGLTGAAGTFGLPHLSDAARLLEDLLAPLARGEHACDPVHARALAQALTQLQQVAAVPLIAAQAPPFAPWPPAAHSELAVYLLQADGAEVGDLPSTLLEAGYRVQRFTDLAALRSACDASAPAALVLDIATPEAVAPALALVQTLVQGLGAAGPPVVAALPSDELAVRLDASRAGVRRTLTRPLEAVRLTGVLDLLTGRRPPQPYRVLLVDDDPLLLQAQAAVLRGAGMEVQALAQPLRTLDELQRFQPDVLLLDVYMPQASGPEIAAALREREEWLDLPVLFLSAETNLTQQLLALNLGGDDFLVKPVQPDHLVAAVTARARRARQSTALRRRLQTTLYEREREHLALDQHAIVSVCDARGRITYANELFCRVSGYAPEQALGLNHIALRAQPHPAGFIRSIRSAIRAGQVWQGEVCCQRRDGSRYWTETTVTPFLDTQGRLYQCVVIQTDISHIKATEAALRAQRDMQRVISLAAASLLAMPPERVPEAIDTALRDSGTQLDADRAYLFTFSRDGSRMNGTHVWCAPGVGALPASVQHSTLVRIPWLSERFMGEAVLQIPDVAELPAQAALDQALLRRSGIRSLIVLPLQREGRPFGFLAYSVRQRRDWTDEEVELLTVLRDVIASALARTWADAALRKSESRLNFLVSSSPVTIYACEPRPPFAPVYVSPNIEPFLGCAPAAFTSDAGFAARLVHPQDLQRVLEQRPQVLAQGELRQEYRVRTRDGSHRWVQDRCRLVRDAAGAPLEIVGYWMDITERKRIEGELSRFNQDLEQRVAEQTRDVLASERLAQGTLDALSARVVILDVRGDIVAANQAWSGFFGGRTPASVGNYLRYCEQMDVASGRDAATHLAPGLRAVLSGGERSHMQEYVQVIDGVTHWFVCRIERFGTEEQPRVVVSHEDITALKQAERQQLRSQRLESLGTLAGGVAHDLNNALAPVLMGMSLLKEQHPEESRLFDMIQGSAQRGADMVRQLLTFARGAEGERVSVCPAQVVRELERLIKGSFPKNIQLLVHGGETLPTVVGDPTQLHQVLLNLCVNARDAMPGGGVLSLRMQVVELDAVGARPITDAVPGRYVTLQVSDTGTGIAPHVLDRIFDPFFTTKGADKGTGLGLSTVLGIVKGHGGFVQVQSQPGEGTAFTVYLPTAATEPGAATAASGADIANTGRGNGETILFVDDEAAVREMGRTVLERLNYHALMATDGADGLVRAAEHRGTLRAVITDLHMPHMDGLAFVRALRRMRPDLPVILASGRVDEIVWTELQALGVAHRLDKPFTQDQLARELQTVLNA